MRSRRRGPGYVAFPRHPVLRVNDLVVPEVPVARVRAALAAGGVPEGDREVPLERGTRALLATTAAGTVVTFESRTGRFVPRTVVLRRLTREWDLLAERLENDARGPVTPA